MTPTDVTAATHLEPADEALLDRLRSATLGEYDVFGVLGKGGMATVYLAHDLSLDRKVAIKVMAPELIHGSDLVERFKREARTAANLSHANIIPIYAVRESQGLNFCVQKLIKGTPLDAIIRELGQLPIAMAQGILAQVGDALDYAHRQGVIHRDIKPANILIDDEGWAIVTDFGIAKVQDSQNLTMTGIAVGTPTYMSPEQCSGGTLSGAADQYSLGVVAFEMLVGHPPFSGGNMMSILYSHFRDTPPAPRELRQECPPEMSDAVLRMLSKQPEERFHSHQHASKAMGAVPLSLDDPVRSHLITLARTGTAHRVVSQVQTPRSPIPLTRSRPNVSAAVEISAAMAGANSTLNLDKKKLPFVVGSAAVLLLAVGFLIARFFSTTPDAGGIPLQNSATVTNAVSSDSTTNQLSSPVSREARGIPGNIAAPQAATPGDQSVQKTSPVVPPPKTEPAPTAPAIKNASTPPTVQPNPVAESTVSAGSATAALAATPPGIVTPPPASLPVSSPISPLVSPPKSPPPVTPVVVDMRPEVVAAIQSFTRALAATDLAAARRIYPTMPADQRDGLAALWKEGGTMTPRWNVSDVVVDGTVATARVQGVNVVTPRRGQPSNVPVSLMARLERRGTEWRLVSLQNP